MLNSIYSELGGIPISWFGLAFYILVFGAAVFEVFGGSATLRMLLWPAAAAFAASVVLTGIQVFVLGAYCEYCLTSAALSTAIFVLVLKSQRTRPSMETAN